MALHTKFSTPFYRYAIANNPPAAPSHEDTSTFDTVKCLQDKNRLDKLNLLPTINWHKQIAATWQPGEKGARQRLQNFIHNGLVDYRDGRDYPAKRSVSMLSPHLHFGEISPREAASMVQASRRHRLERRAGHTFCSRTCVEGVFLLLLALSLPAYLSAKYESTIRPFPLGQGSEEPAPVAARPNGISIS